MSPAYVRRIERFRYIRCKLTPEQAERARQMKARGLTWCAIAAWFTRNGTPVSYQAVKRACERVQVECDQRRAA